MIWAGGSASRSSNNYDPIAPGGGGLDAGNKPAWVSLAGTYRSSEWSPNMQTLHLWRDNRWYIRQHRMVGLSNLWSRSALRKKTFRLCSGRNDMSLKSSGHNTIVR